jgi:glycosyltransferase involved in cell wall biosynthesis
MLASRLQKKLMSTQEITSEPHLRAGAWSVLLPFYNEEAYLETTLASLAAQSLAPDLLLVDNGSNDASFEIVERFVDAHPALSVRCIREEMPGKSSALAQGVAMLETEYVATADADTYYPPDYLQRANSLFVAAGERAVAAMAFGAPMPQQSGHLAARRKGAFVSRLMPRQTHTGGYGQCFRTKALIDAGGFGPHVWPYCLMDHEVMHRLSKEGDFLYDRDFWCAPSPRRTDRGRVRWTLPERLLYHVTPFSRRDWFFYDFLRPRFEARGLSELNLRRKEWTENGKADDS